MTEYNLDLHIEELVLHGFSDMDRAQIGAAVQRELFRLVTEGGIPPALAQGGSVASLDGGTFSSTPNASAEVIGNQIARAVYRGFGR